MHSSIPPTRQEEKEEGRHSFPRNHLQHRRAGTTHHQLPFWEGEVTTTTAYYITTRQPRPDICSPPLRSHIALPLFTTTQQLRCLDIPQPDRLFESHDFTIPSHPLVGPEKITSSSRVGHSSPANHSPA